MNINLRTVSAQAALAALFLSAPLLLAQDRQLTRQQLPATVQHAIDSETQGSTVKGYSTEMENGRRTYEAETIKQGHSRDVSFNPDGTVAEVEEEVPMNDLAANLQQSLKQKAGSARIVKVESLTKHGKLVAYEAATLNGNRRGEIQVGPSGEHLNHEE